MIFKIRFLSDFKFIHKAVGLLLYEIGIVFIWRI